MRCGEDSHSYVEGEDVLVWVNTVGPMSNRQETYEYYNLPFCFGPRTTQSPHPNHPQRKALTIGEALQGIELVDSGFAFRYRQVETNVTVCPNYSLSDSQLRKFHYAIKNNYLYQMYIDDLPIRGWVGLYNATTKQAYLFTHRVFTIEVNKDRIVAVDLKSEDPIEVVSGQDGGTKNVPVEFKYSVQWVESDAKYEDRFDRYLDSDFFERKIHWFSILNSFLMVIFLTGLVAMILMRALRRDFARYDKEQGVMDLDRDLGDEWGWKNIHGDVFRSPPRLMLFSALLGSGTQLLLMASSVILFTILGHLYIQRSSILTASIFVYAVTSILAGYISGSYYQSYGGKSWIKTMSLTAGLLPGVIAFVGILINFVAIGYSLTRAIPIGVMFALLAIFIFMIFPLTLLGTILGRNFSVTSFPCRVNPIPRPIPEKQWYSTPAVLILLGGIIPFGSIFIEMYFIFTSFWQYKIYYVYGFMFLVLGILVIVTACATIVAIYFFLNAEDHRWHWMSFYIGGSVALYVYLYSIYYFAAKTTMYGFFQTTFYFGYTAIACFLIFVMLGTVGHLASNIFIKKIYANVKID